MTKKIKSTSPNKRKDTRKYSSSIVLRKAINYYFEDVCKQHGDPKDPTPAGLALSLKFNDEKEMQRWCDERGKRFQQALSYAYTRIEDHWCQMLADGQRKNNLGPKVFMAAKYKYSEKVEQEINVNEKVVRLPTKIKSGADVPNFKTGSRTKKEKPSKK